MKDFWGFGYNRDKDGKLIRKGNTGDILVKKDVEIGRFTCIDKGSYRDTVIGEGTKLDNLVHIGHNAIIGNHCLIVAGTVVGGSCEIGDFSYVGMNVSIKDHVKIGKRCIVGAGSVVVKDVPDYDIVAGNPAVSIKSKCKIEGLALYNMIGIYEPLLSLT